MNTQDTEGAIERVMKRADEIERHVAQVPGYYPEGIQHAQDLRAILNHVSRLEEALKPFVAEGERFEEIFRHHPEPDDFGVIGLLKWGDFRRARQALSNLKESK